MPRRVEHITVTLTLYRNKAGNAVRSFGDVAYVTHDPSPSGNAKAFDRQDFHGRSGAPAYDGTMTIDELFDSLEGIAKDQGKAT